MLPRRLPFFPSPILQPELMHPGAKKSLLQAPQLSSRETKNLNESSINQAHTIRSSNKVSLQVTRKTSHVKHCAPSYSSELGIIPALPCKPFSSIHPSCEMRLSLLLRGSHWRNRPELARHWKPFCPNASATSLGSFDPTG